MRRSARILLIVGVTIQVVFLASLVHHSHFLNPLFVEGVHNIGEGQGSDFFAFYQAGRYVLEGRDIYQRPMEDDQRVVPYGYFYRYLPFVAYTIGVAVNIVPPWPAYWIWITLIEGVLIACIWATRRFVGDRTLFGYLAAMWLMFTPFYIEQYMGQLTFVMSALVFALVLAHARGRMRSFDVFWILSVLIKHLTVLFVPILIRMKRFRTLAITVALLAATTLPYLLLRPAGVEYFAHDNFSLKLDPLAGNLGVMALFMTLKQHFFPGASRFFGSFGPIAISWTRLMILAVAAVPTLSGLWITLRRRPFDFLESVGLWSMVYFFVFREVWEYHYVILLPLLVLFYARTRARVLWVIYGLLAAPTLFVLYDVPGPHPEVHWSAFVHVLNHSFKVMPLVWLFVWVAAGFLRRHSKKMETVPDTGLAVTL